MRLRLGITQVLSAMVILVSLSFIPANAIELVILANPIEVRSLSGHVRTRTGLNVGHGAHVELYDLETGGLLAACETDSESSFHFKSFGKSAYKIKISMPGFDPLEATFRIKKSAPKSATLTLSIAT